MFASHRQSTSLHIHADIFLLILSQCLERAISEPPFLLQAVSVLSRDLDFAFLGPLRLVIFGAFVTWRLRDFRDLHYVFRGLCNFRVFRSFVTWGFWSYCDLVFSEPL